MNALKFLLATALMATALAVPAQEAAIRKNLPARLPQLQKIDEVRTTPVPGLYEVRVNDSEIYYTDAEANYLIQGSLIDVRERRNLTEERIDKLTAIDFAALPLKDAFTVVRGKGERKLAVFADPNCGYCRRFEHDLAQIDNITIHTFLYPILSQDSATKSRDIWCAKDPGKSWEDWMIREQLPATAQCDISALRRNLALGRKHKITGTPTLIFANGTRVPGALTKPQIEKLLASVR